MKKAVIREGDNVRLEKGVRPIKRVGYKLVWHEISEDVLFSYFDGSNGRFADAASRMSLNARFCFIEGLARAYVQEMKFGGPERMIIRDTDPNATLPPGIYKVMAKRFVKTGTRRERYLHPQRTHCLVTLSPLDVDADDPFVSGGEVELSDCFGWGE